ncbi:hypothetical protein Dsin_000655 [Dipteronia sinensis]|uniref:Uncharacterized protein n=1 Tax=Dipteronia sinensis TaxID=43782 RepID=A0AAE0EHZ9_9ROSI|nr:hypothetical protein Dsin_000655 [Dipteronia sinensis]
MMNNEKATYTLTLRNILVEALDDKKKKHLSCFADTTSNRNRVGLLGSYLFRVVVVVVVILDGQNDKNYKQWITDCGETPIHNQLGHQWNFVCIHLPCHCSPCTLHSLVESTVPENFTSNTKITLLLIEKNYT